MVFFCPASATEKTESQATPTAAGCVLQRPVASWTVLPFFRASAIWAPAAEPIGTSHGWVVGGSSAASVHAMTTAGIACASTPASPSRNRPPPRLPLPGSRTNTPRPSRHRLFLFAHTFLLASSSFLTFLPAFPFPPRFPRTSLETRQHPACLSPRLSSTKHPSRH